MKKQRGFTLLEVLLSLAISSILIVAMAPFLTTLRQQWENYDVSTDHIQNARLAVGTFHRQIRQSTRMISVTDSSNTLGSVAFEVATGEVTGFQVVTEGSDLYFAMIVSGNAEPLAGPVESVTFTGYNANSQETQTPSSIKSIKMTLVLSDSTLSASERTFESEVTLAKDFVSALYYGLYANGDITLSATGTVSGNIHANGTLSNTLMTVTGTQTDSSTSNTVVVPSTTTDILLKPFEPITQYQSIATVVVTSNYTFVKNNVYNGVYYIGNGSSATIELNVEINGSVIAEGNISLEGQLITITPSGTNPALVAGQDIIISNFTDHSFVSNGSIYAGGNIDFDGRNQLVVGNDPTGVGVAASGNILIDAREFFLTGSLVSRGSITLNQSKELVITANARVPVIASEGALTLLDTNAATLTGVLFSGSDIVSEKTLTLTGSMVASGNISISEITTLNYDPENLHFPPIHMWEAYP